MITIDEILKQRNIEYEELTNDELETLTVMLSAVNQSTLSVEKIRDYVASMRQTLELELTKHDLESKQDLFLKARLKNMILMEAFLTSPQRARAYLEATIDNIKAKEIG